MEVAIIMKTTMKETTPLTLVNYDNTVNNTRSYLTVQIKFGFIEGTRRSTRKRKLKYENYSDTWIVGSQALKGYPNMVDEGENGKLSFIIVLKCFTNQFKYTFILILNLYICIKFHVELLEILDLKKD